MDGISVKRGESRGPYRLTGPRGGIYMKEDIGDLAELAKRISKQMRDIERELQNGNLSQRGKISLRGVYAVLAGTLQRVLQALEPSNNEHFGKNWEEMTKTDDPERSDISKHCSTRPSLYAGAHSSIIRSTHINVPSLFLTAIRLNGFDHYRTRRRRSRKIPILTRNSGLYTDAPTRYFGAGKAGKHKDSRKG
jgi:hypothetical protein